MAVSLVNNFIRKTGLISKISSLNQIEWFKGIHISDILMSLVIPCLIIVMVSFVLKKRYDKRMNKLQKRDNYDLDSDSNSNSSYSDI